MTTVLRALLIERHLQSHADFLAAYDRQARLLDPRLVGCGPTKSQYYKWLAGNLRSLPRGHHCRILESMFPGRTAEQLFAGDPAEEQHTAQPPTARSRSDPARNRMADVVAIFPSRSMFLGTVAPESIFTDAREISMTGLSLNLLCEQYPGKRLVELIESGTAVRALFLDPLGHYITVREQEEGHSEGVLKTLTALNIQVLQRLRSTASPSALGCLEIRTYDESPRYNILIVNSERCVAQPYLPNARGANSPTLVIEKMPEIDGLFHTFAGIFEAMWDRGKPIDN